MMQFLKASTDIYIPEKNIKYISDCNGKVIKKLVLEKKKEQKCFDATHGKGAKSVIVLTDNTIVLSPYTGATLCSRFQENSK